MYRSVSTADADYASLVFYCKFEEGSGQSVTESIKGTSGSVLSASGGTVANGTWTDSVALAFTTAEDTAVSGCLIGSDADGDALTYSIMTNGAHGAASIGSGNRFTYMPAANFNGSDSFTYTVTDAHGAESTAQTVSVTAAPVNDAPAGVPTISGTAAVGQTLTASTAGISDPGAGQLQLSMAGLEQRLDGLERYRFGDRQYLYRNQRRGG
jgi:hypothetical protein